MLRPVIILRGDYCIVWKVDKLFVDPGATALDLQQEGGQENILTHLVKINIAFQSKERDELVRIDNNGIASDSFVMPAYLDPKCVPNPLSRSLKAPLRKLQRIPPRKWKCSARG